MADLAQLIKDKLDKAVKGGKAVVVEHDDGASEAYDEAISDMFDAIEAKDKEAFASAFRAAVEICDNDADAEEM